MIATAVIFALYLFGITWRPLVYAGVMAQTAYLLSRGLLLGRLPLVGVHDTLGFLSASMVGYALAIHHTRGQGREYFMMISGLAALLTAGALLQKPHSMPLPPVLNTYWFELHVALSFLSYALFGIAAVMGVLYLRERSPDTERLQHKTIFTGYSFFSLSMIFDDIRRRVGVPGVGHLLALDAQGALDRAPVALLQPLSSRQAHGLVDGKARGGARHSGLRRGDVYVSWRGASHEKLPRVLNTTVFGGSPSPLTPLPLRGKGR
jgi:hypothetical protein